MKLGHSILGGIDDFFIRRGFSMLYYYCFTHCCIFNSIILIFFHLIGTKFCCLNTWMSN